MKKLLLLSFILLSSLTYSQITFEKSYFITNSNEKVDCLIKNMDWQNNPKTFEYKLSENSEIKNGSIDTIKEFKIHHGPHYIRYNTKIDRSSESLNRLTSNRNPVFKEETLFLKVLVTGEANLLLYRKSNFRRFFYRKKLSNIAEQLVYKSYLNENQIVHNNSFRQQLLNRLDCNSIKKNSIEKLEYKKTPLINLFNTYNKCINQDYSINEKPKKSGAFSITVRPGINISSLKLNNSYKSPLIFQSSTTTSYLNKEINIDFSTKPSFRLGLELEYILPFNKNKWSVFTEPTYQYFKAEKQTTINKNKYSIKADYNSIEVPFGVRYGMFLNQNTKVFTNLCIIYDFDLNSEIDFLGSTTLDIKGNYNYALGIGYKHKKYSIEARYYTNRQILSSYYYWGTNYNVVSFILGYTLF